MRLHSTAVVLVFSLSVAATAAAESWIFQPSTYSHDPNTGLRVDQYAMEAPALAPNDPTYRQSGYRHNRTSLRGVGGSVDRRHYVEAWGEGEAIRPYGEWLYPFRAGATPYGPWGNPSGPWTMPFDSWVNPYGLGKLFNPYWSGNPWPGGGYPGHGGPEAAPYPGHQGYGGGGYPERHPMDSDRRGGFPDARPPAPGYEPPGAWRGYGPPRGKPDFPDGREKG